MSAGSAARRPMLLAVGECVLGAALVLFAASRPWVRASAEQGDLRAALELSGSSLAALVPALGLVALAGALPLVAARGWARRGVGLLVLAAGAGAGVAAVLNSRVDGGDLREEAGAALGTEAASVLGVEHTVWPWLTLIGALLIVVAGASAAWGGARWPSMSARYDAPSTDAPLGAPPGAPSGAPPGALPVAPRGVAARAEQADTAALEQWKAFDRGDDPTLR